jgi:hypothetical protein
MHELLPHLAAVVKEARLAAGLSYVHVAARVYKRNGRQGVSESTLIRFEQAKHWPEDADAIVCAYAAAVECAPEQLWEKAIAHASHT